MRQYIYNRVDSDPYPHQIIVSWYIFGWKIGERLYVSEYGNSWYEFPSMKWIWWDEKLKQVLLQEKYVHI